MNCEGNVINAKPNIDCKKMILCLYFYMSINLNVMMIEIINAFINVFYSFVKRSLHHLIKNIYEIIIHYYFLYLIWSYQH